MKGINHCFSNYKLQMQKNLATMLEKELLEAVRVDSSKIMSELD